MTTNSKEYTAAYYLANKASRIAAVKELRFMLREELQLIKESAPCEDCGRWYRYWIMQFDHRPGTKKRCDPSQIPNRLGSFEAMYRELQKCDLVCANCHATRTWERSRDSRI